MSFTKVFISVLFLLLSTSLFAAKPEKELICHVGNEYGPGGEVYTDDPGCVPIEENGYFCPDAGKIDLIEVAKAANHLNTPSHTFEYAPGQFISDYLPADIGASGVGNDDTVGDGVDDGCRPLAPLSCWFPDDQQKHLCADYSVDDCPTGCKVYGFNPTDQTEWCSCYNK